MTAIADSKTFTGLSNFGAKYNQKSHFLNMKMMTDLNVWCCAKRAAFRETNKDRIYDKHPFAQ